MKRIIILILLVFVMFDNQVAAQDSVVVVKPLTVSKRKPVLFNLWVYGMGGRKKHDNVWLANNTFHSSKTLYNTNLDIGLLADIAIPPRRENLRYIYNTTATGVIGAIGQKQSGNSKAVSLFIQKLYTFHATFGMGYRWEHFSFKRGDDKIQGLFHHRMTCEASIGYMVFTMGMSSSVMLKMARKDVDHFTYEGLYDACFNRVSLRWFMGIYLPMSFFELEARFGGYIIPQLNPDSFAYYNMSTISWDGMFFELRLAFRIFTSGNKLN